MICVECGKPIPMPTADAFRCPSCRTRARIDGGAAFPSPTANQSQNGQLTVRDYFAGQALHLYTERPDLTLQDIAHQAYAIASAMLAERAK